eukprot:CAMPEP_0113879144 /NCGR_PEP_ID=MMETSP0780_2-20120614/7072_1 /TAXON_ID=652834 /ORGANISM="Palpitomonas bilix" /LENGTH=523 /DNA_ID=CAMNT_0000865687 /DNA_START=237 /DNA_END=1808 /DNA_ORIENTATION=- /assembly_acc=CAM_ASM_000599
MIDRKTAPPPRPSPPPAGDTPTQVGASRLLPAPPEAESGRSGGGAEHENSGLLSLPTQSYEKLVGKEGPAESEEWKNDTNETEVHLSQDASQSYRNDQTLYARSPEGLTHWGGRVTSQGQPTPAATAAPVTVASTSRATKRTPDGFLGLATPSFDKRVGKEDPAQSREKESEDNKTEVDLCQDASQSYRGGQPWSTRSPEGLTNRNGHVTSQGQPAPAVPAAPVTVASNTRGTKRTRDRSSSPFLTAAEYMKMSKLGARVPLLSVVGTGRSAGQPPSWVPSSSVPRPTCRGDSIPSLPSWTEVSTSPPSAWNANEGGRLPRSPAVPQARASSPSPPRVQLAMLLRSPPAVTEVDASSPSPPPHPAVTDTDTITLSPSSLPEEVMQSANNYKCGHANELALRMDFTRACMLHCLRKHLTRNPHLREEETFSLPGDCLIEDIYNTRQIVITEHGLNQLKGIYPKDQRLIKTIYTVVSELPSLFAETKFRTSQKRSFELHLKVALATVSSTTLSAEEIRCVEFLRA